MTRLRSLIPLLLLAASLPASAQPAPEFRTGRVASRAVGLGVDADVNVVAHGAFSDLGKTIDVLDLTSGCAYGGELHERLLHGTTITGVSVSGDGCKVALTTEFSNTVRILDRCTGRSWTIPTLGSIDRQDTFDPALSRDGSLLVYREAPSFSGSFVDRQTLLAICVTEQCLDDPAPTQFTVIDETSATVDLLLPRGSINGFANQSTPDRYVSDDGGRVAYMKEGRAIVALLDGTGGVTRVPLESTPGVEAVAISGEARRVVALANGRPFPGCPGPTGDVHVLYGLEIDENGERPDINGDGVPDGCRVLGYERIAGFPGFAGDLSLAADGSRVYWATNEIWNPLMLPQPDATNVYASDWEREEASQRLTDEPTGNDAVAPRTNATGSAFVFMRGQFEFGLEMGEVVLRNLHDLDIRIDPLDLAVEEPDSPHDLVDLECRPMGGFPVSDCTGVIRNLTGDTLLTWFGRGRTDGSVDFATWSVQSFTPDSRKLMAFPAPQSGEYDRVVFRAVGPGLQLSVRETATSY